MKGNPYNSVYIFVLVFLACLSFAAMCYQYNVLQDFEYVLPEEELLEDEMLEEDSSEEL